MQDFPFIRKEFDHELVRREGPVCLAKRTNFWLGVFHFEVVQLIFEPDETRFGVRIPGHERRRGLGAEEGLRPPTWKECLAWLVRRVLMRQEGEESS